MVEFFNGPMAGRWIFNHSPLPFNRSVANICTYKQECAHHCSPFHCYSFFKNEKLLLTSFICTSLCEKLKQFSTGPAAWCQKYEPTLTFEPGYRTVMMLQGEPTHQLFTECTIFTLYLNAGKRRPSKKNWGKKGAEKQGATCKRIREGSL